MKAEQAVEILQRFGLVEDDFVEKMGPHRGKMVQVEIVGVSARLSGPAHHYTLKNGSKLRFKFDDQ